MYCLNYTGSFCGCCLGPLLKWLRHLIWCACVCSFIFDLGFVFFVPETYVSPFPLNMQTPSSANCVGKRREAFEQRVAMLTRRHCQPKLDARPSGPKRWHGAFIWIQSSMKHIQTYSERMREAHIPHADVYTNMGLLTTVLWYMSARTHAESWAQVHSILRGFYSQKVCAACFLLPLKSIPLQTHALNMV